MHEVGLMANALSTACDEAERADARYIRRIVLRVGTASGVVPEALRFAFEALAPGTLAEDADFVVEEVPTQCQCHDCGMSYEPEDIPFLCPCCGSPHAELSSGRELELVSIEVES